MQLGAILKIYFSYGVSVMSKVEALSYFIVFRGIMSFTLPSHIAPTYALQLNADMEHDLEKHV